jgi:uncharacterized protein
MRLYAGLSRHFIQDTVHNQIAEKLKDAFVRYYRYPPSPAEIQSWRNSLRAVSQVLSNSDLNDLGIVLEYQLPLTSKRLDCIVCGNSERGEQNAVIVELKQWDKCAPAFGENLVTTWVGGAEREILHPSVQVRQYQLYLEDTHTAFQDNGIRLSSCAYLHNYCYEKDDPIFSDSFKDVLSVAPVFTADDVEAISTYLTERVGGGSGLDLLQDIERGKYRPTKKLMDHVGGIIKGNSEYILLDEQLVVYEKVRACAKRGFHDRKKTVLVVKGGPGTGKSVIAINLMSDLLLGGYNAHYATGSRAFTETLRKIIGSRGSAQFKYFNSYGEANLNDIDVLICDEAHRIRATSASRFTPRTKRSAKAQIQEVIDAAKVSVFFIDDRQIVRPNEIGSVDYINQIAAANGCQLFEYQLEAQFRCAGSDAFVGWVNNTLGLERTANVIWSDNDAFEVRIFDTPTALEAAIREKHSDGCKARVTAGFCWKWSDPKPDGTLRNDVEIGDYTRPWDARPDAKRLAPGIPKASLWAHDPNGINQIGCVYTAQGFEFDYVGVIWGPDLRYDFEKQSWEGHRESSADSEVKKSKTKFAELVKNVYRVLLTRGMKGCYIYFMDKDTERFVRSRLEGQSAEIHSFVQNRPPESSGPEPATAYPFKILPYREVRPFVNCVPVYELKIAAGRFAAGEVDEERNAEEMVWAELPDAFRPRRGLFVTQVVGESMNRRIPNGAWCLFSANPVGTRHGRVVLVQHRSIADPETGGNYTVKLYESEKAVAEEGGWRHKRIILRPDSTAVGYEPISFDGPSGDDLKVIAELIAVL